MKRWLNIMFQIVGTTAQGFNIAGGFIPPKYQLAIATGIGAAQAVISVIAHNYNPDGTNAVTSYKP